MYSNQRCRSGKHSIRVTSDRRSNGQCAQCSRDNEARYRSRRNERLARLAAIEAVLA